MRVIDLGCGSGELTRHLHETLRAKRTIGVDSSQNMLDRAITHTKDGLTFQRGDIGTHQPDSKFDLVFSNAALQWVPNAREVLARLAGWLDEEGQLAVQVPANDDHPTHVVARDLAARSPYREALKDWKRQFFVLKPEEYAAMLHRIGFRRQHVRLQVYGHLLPSREDEIEWVKGTMLTDYQRNLPPDLFAKFRKTTAANSCPSSKTIARTSIHLSASSFGRFASARVSWVSNRCVACFSLHPKYCWFWSSSYC